MQDLEGEQGSVQITEVGLDCFNVFKEILDTSNSQLVLSFSSNNAYFMASICVWLVTCMADDCNSKQRSCCTEDFSLAMRVDKGHICFIVHCLFLMDLRPRLLKAWSFHSIHLYCLLRQHF